MNEKQFDNIVGTGQRSMGIGAYPDPQAEGKTRYKFLVRFDLPTFPEDVTQHLALVGALRLVSVRAAGTFNKENAFGELADAQAFQQTISTLDGWTGDLLVKKQRAKGEAKVSGITPLVQASRDVLEAGLIIKKGLDAKTISAADLKAVRTEVREHQKAGDALWQWALKKGEKELEARAKKLSDMPDLS